MILWTTGGGGINNFNKMLALHPNLGPLGYEKVCATEIHCLEKEFRGRNCNFCQKLDNAQGPWVPYDSQGCTLSILTGFSMHSILV